MKINFAIIGIALLLAVAGCKEVKKEKEETKELPQDQLQLKVKQLEDSASQAWQFMIQADDQKIAFTKRLLDEVSYTPKYNVIKHEKLVEKCKNLKQKRFDSTSVTSEKIDRYDMATDSLLKEVKDLVVNTPNVENYPLCNELLNDISALDNDVVMHRVKYDNWAMKYNTMVEENKEELKAMGQPYQNLQKKPTFQLDN